MIFTYNGDIIGCTKIGSSSKGIPRNIDHVGNMKSDDALFILLVEKDSAFLRLTEDRFYNRFPCVIVKPREGPEPDLATMKFLGKMRAELKLPVFALVDCDSCVLKRLGMRPGDLEPEKCRLPMTTEDVKTVENMLRKDYVKKNRGWVDELILMVKTGKKAEIEALCNFDFRFLSEVYLPLKLQELDWI